MNSNWFCSIIWLPKEFIRSEMEVQVGRGSGDLLPDHRHQPAMMKDSCIKLFWPWVLHLSVKGNIDLDWGFHQVSVILLVLPAIQVCIFRVLTVLSTQLSINTAPIKIGSDTGDSHRPEDQKRYWRVHLLSHRVRSSCQDHDWEIDLHDIVGKGQMYCAWI